MAKLVGQAHCFGQNMKLHGREEGSCVATAYETSRSVERRSTAHRHRRRCRRPARLSSGPGLASGRGAGQPQPGSHANDATAPRRRHATALRHKFDVRSTCMTLCTGWAWPGQKLGTSPVAGLPATDSGPSSPTQAHGTHSTCCSSCSYCCYGASNACRQLCILRMYSVRCT